MIALSLIALGAAADYTLHEEALPGGDTLVVVTDDRAPVVYLRVDFPVGDASPWADPLHTDDAWAIQRLDPDGALRAREDALATRVRVGQGTWTASVSLTALVDDLPATLELVGDVLHNRDFDKAELKRWKKARDVQWEGNLKSPQWRMRQAIAQAVIADPEDPRRRAFEGVEPVGRDRAALADVRDAVLRTPGRIVGVASDVTPEQARAIAAALLPASEPLPGPTDPVYGVLTEAAARPAETVVEVPNLTQVYFGLVRDGLDYADPRWPAAMVANHVLAGHAHARLGQALRYDEGATYGVSLRGAAGLHPGALTISTYTRVDNAADAEAKLVEALATFHEGGITEAERADAVSAIEGRELFRQQAPWTPLGERMWELRHDLPAGFRQSARDRAMALTLDEINAFITGFYDPAGFVTFRVIPEE